MCVEHLCKVENLLIPNAIVLEICKFIQNIGWKFNPKNPTFKIVNHGFKAIPIYLNSNNYFSIFVFGKPFKKL